MRKNKLYKIYYNNKCYEINAMSFYSACKKVLISNAVKKGVLFYVGRLIETGGKKAKLTDYLITTDKVEIVEWLKNRYVVVDTVHKYYGWVIAGDTPLSLYDCVDNISNNISEPSIVDIVSIGKNGLYVKQFSFDVIALKT